ncbi:TIGR01459 family HAD-type hydrolase [Chelativorans sp. AA-79]|uniref:TIGR01459 family HAD-type hydrolase n=1 Tax=Chelativorans sp. AA-79 TaxID=3028735 RepID=UPI0023FA3D6E|nr:TIGR01459 family HAD-type hydrolase [Chelativorans sp. AA-79]WEX08369.1 TIGR01459 family HAD-type hydrolase [Chelativorans sp. AA-79]
MGVSRELQALIAAHDVFFVDQFGTLHDGSSPYPGAVEALLAMRQAGKTVVILSNSGKSGTDNAARFVGLGFPAGSFDHFVTSGDVAVDLLRSGAAGLAVSPATRCFTISSGNDANLAERLGLAVVERAGDADLVVISGSQADRIGLDGYAALLRPAAEVGVQAICTNPDIRMLTPNGLAPAAGSIAKLYETLGGRVLWVGKPHAPIYEYAHRLCGAPAKERIVAIGDSLEHDIAGAAAFGIHAVLVRLGVSAEATEEALRAEAAEAGVALAGILDRVA